MMKPMTIMKTGSHSSPAVDGQAPRAPLFCDASLSPTRSLIPGLSHISLLFAHFCCAFYCHHLLPFVLPLTPLHFSLLIFAHTLLQRARAFLSLSLSLSWVDYRQAISQHLLFLFLSLQNIFHSLSFASACLCLSFYFTYWDTCIATLSHSFTRLDSFLLTTPLILFPTHYKNF